MCRVGVLYIVGVVGVLGVGVVKLIFEEICGMGCLWCMCV